MVRMFCTRKIAVLLCIVQLTFVTNVLAQTKTSRNSNTCISQNTCADCIRTTNCVWCREDQEIFEKKGVAPKPRCKNRESTKSASTTWCPKEMIVDRSTSTVIIENREFSSLEDDQVQIMPQHVKMVLRRGQTETLKIRYKAATDYPVDLYFLMDLSASMEKYRENLSKLGTQLRDEIGRLTKNFRLGFGSFVDKVLLPMTNTQPGWLETYCLRNSTKKCAPPYGYKNQMKLTDRVDDFQREVQAAPISGNVDAPEGGLDAMMQAIVCGDKIGWRKNGRRILVYSSDDIYHIAGDGKLAGVIEPNDEQCHLNETGFYTHAEILDYPSISQINKQALKHGINIIFAVPSNMTEPYEMLKDHIKYSAVGILDENSHNVVSLVHDHYEKLTKTITMTSSRTEMIEVKFFTKCLNDDKSELQERNDCSGVLGTRTLEFDVAIKAVDCPKNMEKWRQTIELNPQGVTDKVMVDVELICDCPCSRQDDESYVPNSTKCYGKGDLTCGACHCEPGFRGKKCDCDNDTPADMTLNAACYGDNSTNRVACSGHGKCLCGECECDHGPILGDMYSGKLCECDNFSCERLNGKVCGGQGKCECGICLCNPDLSGKNCDCSTKNSTCIPPGENTIVCSGFGDCVCGKCECKLEEGRSGDFCEECPTCPTERCDELKNCVECKAYYSGPEYEEGENCENCDDVEVELVEDINESRKAVHKKGIHVCSMPDSSGCTFVFTYESGRGDASFPIVKAEKEKKCAKPAFSPFSLAGGAIGITLFLGFLGLLIWKLLTMYHDHREWIKFEKERVSANWGRGENPLFKEPTTSFKNPTFGNEAY